ncbi:MAG: hypothetical protein B7O98_01500 [Zestosphaera tikiterensis]|uniref:Uncharacterized protein n=1 Tax=Zestosphaera tikiterensis TaxID=1973259 RepID=A0A2R7Y6H3_9CREN|nr:MAG: hypothetical protein B7O98_01500 [Zestosphaera tikiterensis]
MEIRPLREGVSVKLGMMVVYKSRRIKLEEFSQLFNSFISFEEGRDWGLYGNILAVKHPNLVEVALIYTALRAGGQSPEEARKIVNVMRVFEFSSLALILLYRLSIDEGRYGYKMRKLGKAIAKMFEFATR